jgi:hypothetical protein
VRQSVGLSIDFGLALNASRDVVHALKAHEMNRALSTRKYTIVKKAPNNVPAITKTRREIGVESTQLEFSLAEQEATSGGVGKL